MTENQEERRKHALDEQERRDERDRWSDSAIDREPVLGRRGARRLTWAALLLLVTLPPLLNVSRYQRRIASAIAESIGRPVRFDSIELHLLPLPGFTIHNFVVMENGAFGAEPAMRANVVEARVRFGSLWRRRVEISHIRLQAPTVNLVRNDAGYWNLQGVVSQAAQVQSAPTAQARAGDAPRFPYIEATDARVNLKLGETKMPYSLTEAEFALWLPDADAWRLRLSGRPMRTDTDATDVGVLRVEATLGRDGNRSIAQEPLTLEASWKPTPLGEASKLFVGSDTGWRGSLSAEMKVDGTPAAMHTTTDVHVRDLRRTEFVPAETLELDAHCEAEAMGIVHGLHAVRCAMPTGEHASLLEQLPFFKTATDAATTPDVLTLQAEIPSVTDWQGATSRLAVQAASPAWALRWLRLFSSRMSPAARVGGTFSLLAQHSPESPGWAGTVLCHCTLHAAAGEKAAEPWLLQASHGLTADSGFTISAVQQAADDDAPATAEAGPVAMPAGPITLPVGPVAVSGSIGLPAATLRYQSAAIARRWAAVVPALGDDLPAEETGPVTSERVWGHTQVWTAAAPAVTAPAHRHRGRRR